MISRPARDAMNELDDLAEEKLNDQRSYSPRRDYYETALDEAWQHGDFDTLESVKSRIATSIKNESPVGQTTLFRRTRRILKRADYSIPDSSPLHRGGRAA